MFVSSNWACQDTTDDSPPLKADCNSWHFLYVANQGNMEANDRPVVERRYFSILRLRSGWLPISPASCPFSCDKSWKLPQLDIGPSTHATVSFMVARPPSEFFNQDC